MANSQIKSITKELHKKPCSSSDCSKNTWKWQFPAILKQLTDCTKYAVLVLNRPITQDPCFIKNLWNDAAVRITVDGGTVQWDAYISNIHDDTFVNPDLITGDFDSITESVQHKYLKKGCKFVNTPDQNYTDFTKALVELSKTKKMQDNEIDHVIAIGQSSGRLDHTLGNIQTLYLAKEEEILGPNTHLYLLTDDAISWLLYPGQHIIDVPQEATSHNNTWCSLTPIGEACDSCTTQGLKWNLDKQRLRFGELVSTSNTFDGQDRVFVHCSHTLLWSMEVPGLLSTQ